MTADIYSRRKFRTLRSEMRSFTKLLGMSLGISYKDHITVTEAVRDKIRHAIGPCSDILTTIRNVWR